MPSLEEEIAKIKQAIHNNDISLTFAKDNVTLAIQKRDKFIKANRDLDKELEVLTEKLENSRWVYNPKLLFSGKGISPLPCIFTDVRGTHNVERSGTLRSITISSAGHPVYGIDYKKLGIDGSVWTANNIRAIKVLEKDYAKMVEELFLQEI